MISKLKIHELPNAKRKARQEDQTRSTKGSPSTKLQAPLAETVHETLNPKMGGGGVTPHGVFNNNIDIRKKKN